jgi:phosphoribosyl 1,2-cyclic phosphodiesterase
VRITFYGVRGSCPCPSETTRRYGGNTACVALTVAGEAPLVFDLGTGLRAFGATQPLDGSFRGAALVTHLHWDHVQGLPFFPPSDRPGAVFDIYGPAVEGQTLAAAFGDFMRPPYFPVRAEDPRGAIRFHDVADDELAIGNAKVTVRRVPHVGATVGYRVVWDGASVAYVSDHQAPPSFDRVDPGVLELAEGVDVLVHDAQYTAEEFEEKAHWGHCTVDYAVDVALRAGVGKLVLFHHDPAHDDDDVDRLLARARARAGPDLAVDAAWEGLTLDLGS